MYVLNSRDDLLISTRVNGYIFMGDADFIIGRPLKGTDAEKSIDPNKISRYYIFLTNW